VVTARVEWLSVSGDPDVWRSFGFVVADGLLPLHGTSLRIVPPAGQADANRPVSGITSWALSGIAPDALASTAVDDATIAEIDGLRFEIDGLHTDVVESLDPTYGAHDLGATGLDHVVVLTADLERTSGAITAATGCELKRIREVGEMRQGFHRIGPGGLIVELVERPDVPAGPARFWGLVLIVDDLDVACDRLGAERVTPPKDAVQPGRRIATVRADAGLGLPVALMSR
jgi:hypothetical protein